MTEEAKNPNETSGSESLAADGSARLSSKELVEHDSFFEGYNAGCDDPGFVKAIIPKMEDIINPYPVGSVDHVCYQAGYIQAIK
jgi:hypothetical protein